MMSSVAFVVSDRHHKSLRGSFYAQLLVKLQEVVFLAFLLNIIAI